MLVGGRMRWSRLENLFKEGAKSQDYDPAQVGRGGWGALLEALCCYLAAVQGGQQEPGLRSCTGASGSLFCSPIIRVVVRGRGSRSQICGP